MSKGCSATDTCGVHYQNDYEQYDNLNEEALVITYRNGYAIVTSFNEVSLPKEGNDTPQGFWDNLQWLAYQDLYRTDVYKVGEKGLIEIVKSGIQPVFSSTFDEYRDLKKNHDDVVAVYERAGLSNV